MKRRTLSVLITIALNCVVLVPISSATVAANEPEPPAIRVTPPAPVFDDARRLEELTARRKKVADSIGPKSMLILFGAEPRVYTNDVDFPFRQENNFFYLTNLNQQREILVLMPEDADSPEILFIPRRSARAETWTGHMYSPEEAAKLSGVREIWETGEFAPFIAALQKHEEYRPKPENILYTAGHPAGAKPSSVIAAAEKKEASLYLLADFSANADSREYRQEQRFASAWSKDTGFTIKNASQIFAQMRLRKSPMEIEIMQHAIDISIEAHQRAQTFASQAQWEYEVDAQVAYTFKLRNADNWGYPDIVGCGKNATTLHYEE